MIFVMTVLEVQTNELFDSVARVWRNGRILPGAMVAVAALLAGGGCTQTILTAPQRSATEQLLLSTAAERAVASINFSLFSGKKVFLDVSNFDSYDSKYAIGSIRDALSRSGALLVRNETNSDIIVEARSGALSIDASGLLIGMPSAAMPVLWPERFPFRNWRYTNPRISIRWPSSRCWLTRRMAGSTFIPASR